MPDLVTIVSLAALLNAAPPRSAQGVAMPDLRVIPYPQQVTALGGRLVIGPALYEAAAKTPTVLLAQRSLSAYLPKSGARVRVRMGSVEEGYEPSWLPSADRDWLGAQTSKEASVLRIERDGITVVGTGRWGMLYGVQTVNQLLSDESDGVGQVRRIGPKSLPCLAIRDWPDMRWRCLSPQMTWYSGYNRLEGYDCGNWTLDEWKWLADWSLLHKCNGWAMCMYGNWPFTVPGYGETTLDVPSFRYNPATGRKEPYRFVHRNVRKEFLPDMIRYANERGIQVYAYIGKNSFNGTYGLKHPDANAGGAAELIPFHPGVREYWDAMIRRITELGFNGYVFEDPEALHVPNQNEQCYRTFWEPWAKTYGFSSVAETDQNKPPLGVHVEYYTWLFRTFDEMLRRHAHEMGKPEPEIYLISHILLSRMVSESKTQEERDRWFALIDEKQGRKIPFVILEADEAKYVSFLGHDRVASLGGRGGSCTNAMRRTASINNNWVHGGMGGDLAYERQCQKRIYEAGGFGAMAYIFEWTNTEPFGYLGAQYLWRNAGIPGIDNDNQTDFLYRACRMLYGDRAGELAARAFDEGSCVNDAMILEGVSGSQFPETGAPLHRDYQYLAVLADRAVDLAYRSYRSYTTHAPSLATPAYPQESFRWSGFDRAADLQFKSERLRLLYVSAVRSRHMCDAVLAHRKAQRLIADGGSCGAVVAEYDRAIAEARASERLYQANFDDDYDWTDGLCSKVTESLEAERGQFLASVSSTVRLARKPLRIPWERTSDIVPRTSRAAKPSRYLSVDLGCDAREDYFRLGVVFSVEARDAAGIWKTVFRRSLGRRHVGWEHWDIPVDRLVRRGSLAMRFVTDCYSRAQNRAAPTWKWPLWGRPQVVEVTASGDRRVLYDCTDHVGDAVRLVRMDADGVDRPFGDGRRDASGAVFTTAEPGPIARLRTGELGARQWARGFVRWQQDPSHHSGYKCWLGDVQSGWTYAHESAPLKWETDPVPERRPTAFAWIGGTGYAPGQGELWRDGRKLLAFDMAKPADGRWIGSGAELRYVHGGDTRSPEITFGISGVYVLLLAPEMVTPGKPLSLEVKLPPGAGDWYMVHEYADPEQACSMVVSPEPAMPAIAAFPPHEGGRQGVTIGEYTIRLERRVYGLAAPARYVASAPSPTSTRNTAPNLPRSSTNTW